MIRMCLIKKGSVLVGMILLSATFGLAANGPFSVKDLERSNTAVFAEVVEFEQQVYGMVLDHETTYALGHFAVPDKGPRYLLDTEAVRAAFYIDNVVPKYTSALYADGGNPDEEDISKA
ncbi:MAG: hypothetical protein AAF226_07620, partial [Verrucomicrobiota bacterium]